MKAITVNIKVCHQTTESSFVSQRDARHYSEHHFEVKADTVQEAVGEAYKQYFATLNETEIRRIPYTTFDVVTG